MNRADPVRAHAGTLATRRWLLRPALLCAAAIAMACARDAAPPIGELKATYERRSPGSDDRSLICVTSLSCDGRNCFLITRGLDRCRGRALRFQETADTVAGTLKIRREVSGDHGVIVAEAGLPGAKSRYHFEFTLVRKGAHSPARFGRLISFEGAGSRVLSRGGAAVAWRAVPVEPLRSGSDGPCGESL